MVPDAEVFNYQGYGFLTTPFMLLVFLNPSVFTLELIRQRISTDEEHFAAHTKESWIKYPINFGPFVVKKPSALPMVEKVLKAMNFQVTHAQNYDPKGIISQRSVHAHRSVFIHSMIPELSLEANSIAYDFDWTHAEKFRILKKCKVRSHILPFP